MSVTLTALTRTVIDSDGLFFAVRHRSPGCNVLQPTGPVECCLAAIIGRAMARVDVACCWLLLRVGFLAAIVSCSAG